MRDYPSEIRLAVQERLPVCFILMTDGLFGSIACTSETLSRRAVTIFGSSWLKTVEGMGCLAVAANSIEAFAQIIQSWNRQEPLYIEASFDPQSYALMTRRLR